MNTGRKKEWSPSRVTLAGESELEVLGNEDDKVEEGARSDWELGCDRGSRWVMKPSSLTPKEFRIS